jgi:hypothetical protein
MRLHDSRSPSGSLVGRLSVLVSQDASVSSQAAVPCLLHAEIRPGPLSDWKTRGAHEGADPG